MKNLDCISQINDIFRLREAIETIKSFNILDKQQIELLEKREKEISDDGNVFITKPFRYNHRMSKTSYESMSRLKNKMRIPDEN